MIAENYRPSSSRVLLPFLMLHAQRVFDLLTAWCVFDYKWCLVRWSLFANGKTKSQFDLIKRSDEGSSYESMDINKQDIWMTHAFDSGGGEREYQTNTERPECQRCQKESASLVVLIIANKAGMCKFANHTIEGYIGPTIRLNVKSFGNYTTMIRLSKCRSNNFNSQMSSPIFSWPMSLRQAEEKHMPKMSSF